MAKGKGSSTSSPRARKKSDKKKGSKAKISERGAAAADEKEFWQLRCEVYPLLGELDKLSEQKRKLNEQLRQLRREEGQLQRKLLPKSNRLKELCSSREAENTQRLLDKLPLDVWEKILDENDLFPLALSCRSFRQKQKDLVARTGQNGSESGKPGLTLRTTFIEFYEEK